jgi:hypothetical protein
MRTAALALGLLVLVLLAYVWWRERRFEVETRGLVTRLQAPTPRPDSVLFSADSLRDLPEPVSRYLRAVVREGRPLVRRAHLRQTGRFLVQPAEGRWIPFDAVQEVSVDPPGFVWGARMRMGPGVQVLVRDALVGGRGSMVASVMGIVSLTRVEGTPEIAAGALHRYLAEAAWYPTALLPAAGVHWTVLDDSSARATLTSGTTTVSLDFHFGPDHLVESVFTPARGRDVEGRSVPTPWRGRWSSFEERDGMRIPLAGEVEWVLPEGPLPYWRGQVRAVAYDGNGG